MSSNLVAVSKEAKLKTEFIKYGIGYHARISALNFANPSEARNKINSWGAKKTKNMISKIFKDPPSAMTVMMAINAIYFKREWNEAFDTNLTEPRNFVNADGKIKKVPMMSRRKGTKGRYHKRQTFGVS